MAESVRDGTQDMTRMLERAVTSSDTDLRTTLVLVSGMALGLASRLDPHELPEICTVKAHQPQ